MFEQIFNIQAFAVILCEMSKMWCNMRVGKFSRMTAAWQQLPNYNQKH